MDFELNVLDSQKPSLVGLHREFISGPRLDNLGSSLLALDSLVDTSRTLSATQDVNMIMLFDHEEVGSTSA